MRSAQELPMVDPARQSAFSIAICTHAYVCRQHMTASFVLTRLVGVLGTQVAACDTARAAPAAGDAHICRGQPERGTACPAGQSAATLHWPPRAVGLLRARALLCRPRLGSLWRVRLFPRMLRGSLLRKHLGILHLLAGMPCPMYNVFCFGQL